MKHALVHPFQLTVIILLALGLAACGTTPTQEDEDPTRVKLTHAEFDIPAQWVRSKRSPVQAHLTRDGESLQLITYRQRPLELAFPALRKDINKHAITTDIDAFELAERYQTMVGSVLNKTVTVFEKAPATIDGKPGFYLTMQHTDDNGLRINHATYGFVTDQGFFELYFRAPALYFYERDLPAFETMVQSFSLLESQFDDTRANDVASDTEETPQS